MRNHFKIIVLLLGILTMVNILAAYTLPPADTKQYGKTDTPVLDNNRTA